MYICSMMACCCDWYVEALIMARDVVGEVDISTRKVCLFRDAQIMRER